MWKTGMSLSGWGFPAPPDEKLRVIRAAGFDSFFTGMVSEADLDLICRTADEVGLVYESIHAPFGGINAIWDEGEKGEAWVPTLKAVADRCLACGIGYFTLHCMNVPQFNPADPGMQKWSELGLRRFAEVVEYAAKCGVRACFENVEFPQYEMRALLDRLRTICPEGLGITWDVGHEHCYPGGLDVVAEFGDLLVGTHVHDNNGQQDPAIITWNDDSHLLPYEGSIDFDTVAARLRSVGYRGSITIETGKAPADGLRRTPVPENCTMTQYLTMIHDRAARIAALEK